MSTVVSPERIFQSPTAFFTYLETNEKFTKERFLSPYRPMCADRLQNELNSLSEIAILFRIALKNSQGFASNIEIKKLIHAYRIFLTNASSAIAQVMVKSVTISNNCRAIVRLVEAKHNHAAKLLLNKIKELFQQSSRMFVLLKREANALKTNEKSLFIIQENVAGDALAAIVKNTDAIQTRLLDSGHFWGQIQADEEFTADVASLETLIEANIAPQVEAKIRTILSRWLELVRVTQLVGQSIPDVLASLPDPLS